MLLLYNRNVNPCKFQRGISIPANYNFLIILISIVLLSCRSIKEPIYNGIDDLRINKIDLNESVLSINLKCFNPNKWGLKLKEAEGDAWLAGNFLGHFKMDTLIHISGNSDFNIPVNLVVNMKDVYKNAFNVILNPEVIIKVEGTARFGKGGIFIRYPIRYEGKQNLSEIFNKTNF